MREELDSASHPDPGKAPLMYHDAHHMRGTLDFQPLDEVWSE